MNVATLTKGKSYEYQFCCEGCSSTGVLTVPRDHKAQIPCPAGCGASYVQWQNLLKNNRIELMCVVKPIVIDEGDDDDDVDPRVLRSAINRRKEYLEANGVFGDDEEVTDEDALEDLMGDCGLQPDGTCLNAGSEDCDFDCPFS